MKLTQLIADLIYRTLLTKLRTKSYSGLNFNPKLMTLISTITALTELLEQLTIDENFNGMHFLIILADTVEQRLLPAIPLRAALIESANWWQKVKATNEIPIPDRIEREIVANCSGRSITAPDRDLRYENDVVAIDQLEVNRSHVTKLNVLLNRHIRANSDEITALRTALSLPLSDPEDELHRFFDYLNTPEGRLALIDDAGSLGYYPDEASYPGDGGAWIAPSSGTERVEPNFPDPNFYLSNRALNNFVGQWMVMYSFGSDLTKVQCRPTAVNGGSTRFQIGALAKKPKSWGTSVELDLLTETQTETINGNYERVAPPLKLIDLKPDFRLVGFVEKDHNGYSSAFDEKFLSLLLRGRAKKDLISQILTLMPNQ